VAAFLIVYVAALVVLLVSAFWRIDDFTSEIVRDWGFGNFSTLWHDPSYRTIALRTLGLASAVTVTCVVLAFPYALFLVRVATPRLRVILLVATVLPPRASANVLKILPSPITANVPAVTPRKSFGFHHTISG